MKDNIIEVKNVNFTYTDAKEPCINKLTFNIKKQTWTAIIGHNGSGKSTLARLLNGLLVPDENQNDPAKIIIDGIALNKKSVCRIRQILGIVFQNPDNQFVGATVADDVAFGLENLGIPRLEMLKMVDDALEKVDMLKYKEAEPENLSGGQKQRVAIAGILAIHPKIIILDEATSMLDPEGRKRILKIMHQMQKQEQLTILSITHDINEANAADQVMVINDGKLVAKNTPSKIFQNTELIKQSGLELPFEYQLIQKLNDQGIKLDKTINNRAKLVETLCQLNLKM